MASVSGFEVGDIAVCIGDSNRSSITGHESSGWMKNLCGKIKEVRERDLLNGNPPFDIIWFENHPISNQKGFYHDHLRHATYLEAEEYNRRGRYYIVTEIESDLETLVDNLDEKIRLMEARSHSSGIK